MKEGDKYYYYKRISSTRHTSQLVRWNIEYQVDVDEEVDYCQYISFSAYKLKQENIEEPASTEYEKFTPVNRDVFLNHYSVAVKHIHEAKMDEGECYILQNSKDWFIVRYFSKNEKQKFSIEIDFRDSVESLWMTIHTNHGHKHRPASRKNGTSITLERFRQFLTLTIQFLYNSDCYLIFLSDYIKNIHKLAKGETKVEGLLISTEKALVSILEQLDTRKISLEKRLIENDNDSSIDRAKLRGEIEGIQYAITAINSHVSNLS